MDTRYKNRPKVACKECGEPLKRFNPNGVLCSRCVLKFQCYTCGIVCYSGFLNTGLVIVGQHKICIECRKELQHKGYLCMSDTSSQVNIREEKIEGHATALRITSRRIMLPSGAVKIVKEATNGSNNFGKEDCHGTKEDGR